MKRKIRIGAVSYLNARPLVFGLEQGLLSDRVELVHDVPSALAERMARGDLDVSLLPVAGLAEIPGLEIVPGLAIVSRGPARSVFLVAKCPPSEVRRVALDPESRTSNAMTRVLLAEHWGARPEFEIGGLDLAENLASFDAVLRMGDKALFEEVPETAVAHDLGEVWTASTGLPFVYAVWAIREGVLDRQLYQAFHQSKREGTKMIDAIAEDYTWEGRRYPELSRSYLRENIRFLLGADEMRGLRRFMTAAVECGAIASPPPLRLALTAGTSCDDPRVGEAVARDLGNP